MLVSRWEADVLRKSSGDADYREVILPVKVALDDWYVSNSSFTLDLLVLMDLVRLLAGKPPVRLLRRARAEVRGLEGLVP